MIPLVLTDQDKASITHVSDALGAGFIATANVVLMPFSTNPAVSPIGLLLGIVQAHMNGLASAMSQMDEPLRDRLIAGVPAQLNTIIARTANERG